VQEKTLHKFISSDSRKNQSLDEVNLR